MEIRVMGLREAEAYLARLQGTARSLNGAAVVVGTDLAYAWGMAFGRYRSGRLARRLGGDFALTDAFAAVKPSIPRRLREALSRGPAAALAALQLAGQDVLTGTKQRLLDRLYSVPIPSGRDGKPKWRRTSTLRRSYHVETVHGSLRSQYTRAA